jgi:hypothetical protein
MPKYPSRTAAATADFETLRMCSIVYQTERLAAYSIQRPMNELARRRRVIQNCEQVVAFSSGSTVATAGSRAAY